MMRIVVANHMHPSVPHVSGMRVWHFARELASRGHQVILICEWREGVSAPPAPAELAAALNAHDWRMPFVLAVRPTPAAMLERVRSSETPALIRKALVVWQYLRHSGMFTDFSDGAQVYFESIARVFKPQVTWGSFGNTDCWLIAQRLGRRAGCAWVGDMKDAWGWWIPVGLRSMVARRFRNMSAGTANSEFHGEAMERWFPTRPATIYSGVEPEWIEPALPPLEGFRVMVIGGTYDRRDLNLFIRGFASWVQRLPEPERERVTLCYAGSDADVMRAALNALAPELRADVRGYLPLSELALMCRGAAANVYLWSPATFHHKVVELLCCRRPIISVPGERNESVSLAQQVGGSLNVCADAQALARTLDAIWEGALQPTGGADRLKHLTWSAQVNQLEAVLQRVANPESA